jgi:hypothetical protein
VAAVRIRFFTAGDDELVGLPDAEPECWSASASVSVLIRPPGSQPFQRDEPRVTRTKYPKT